MISNNQSLLSRSFNHSKIMTESNNMNPNDIGKFIVVTGITEMSDVEHGFLT